MHTDEHKSEIDRVTQKIIGCAFTAGNRLGCGFLEKFMRTPWLLSFVRPVFALLNSN
jgi:hypothetical protein